MVQPWQSLEAVDVVVIFGWGSEAKDLGEVAPATCPKCGNHVFLHQIRSQKQISLYFVPLVSHGGNEYLACPICRNGLALRPEHRQAVEHMRMETRQFRRGVLGRDAYQARVEQFWRTLGVGPSGGQVVHAAPTIPQPGAKPAQPVQSAQAATTAAAASDPSLREQLQELARLHDDGILTDDEFAAAKRRILGI